MYAEPILTGRSWQYSPSRFLLFRPYTLVDGRYTEEVGLALISVLRQATNDADGTDGTNIPLRWDLLAEAMREWKREGAGKDGRKRGFFFFR